MPITVEGKMVDGRTIVLDQPLANGQNEILVKLKKKTGRTRIAVPEQFVMMIAETDIEELYK
jgi:glycerol-3-phosphate dehydrogenase